MVGMVDVVGMYSCTVEVLGIVGSSGGEEDTVKPLYSGRLWAANLWL